ESIMEKVMKLRSLVIGVSVSLIMLASFQSSAEEEWGFIGEVGTSHKDVTFEGVEGESGDAINFNPKLLTLDYAGAFFYQNFYTHLKVSQTIKDDSTLDDVNSIVTMSRYDMDITLGYYVGSGFSVFTGYKSGELEAFVFGDAARIGTGADPTEPNPDSNTQASFKDDGPFIGVSYLLPMDESSFSFSFAYADMDGKITITNGGDGGGGGTTTGSTTGFSYSASWNKPVSDQTSFVAALNVIRYTYDDTAGLGLDFSADQSFDNISLALRHYF
ncbi:MAG: hypothetical protein KAI17_24165, partial [Thiotrichaceae bacterium]|nr:hypothetical protein [Thiotrichaceae bacterium]